MSIQYPGWSEFVEKGLAAVWMETVHKVEQIVALQSRNCKEINVEGIVSQFVRIGTLRLHGWFSLVYNLAF